MRWKALQHVWKLKFRVDRSGRKKISSALSLTFQCFSFISVQNEDGCPFRIRLEFTQQSYCEETKRPMELQKIRSVCAFYFLQWNYSLFAPALMSELEGVCLRPLIHSISIQITMKKNSERSSEEKNVSRRIFLARRGVGRDL